jgi:hypothetical protein
MLEFTPAHESAIKEAGIRLEQNKATRGAGAGGQLRTVPYVLKQVRLGDIKEENVPGLYDGPFPWEDRFGFYLAGMMGHDFFKDFENIADAGAKMRRIRTPFKKSNTKGRRFAEALSSVVPRF